MQDMLTGVARTFTSEPSRDDLLGALSLIIWTLTLMVSIKYVMIVLLADDEGEGGTFALYSLLSRYVGPKKLIKPSDSSDNSRAGPYLGS